MRNEYMAQSHTLLFFWRQGIYSNLITFFSVFFDIQVLSAFSTQRTHITIHIRKIQTWIKTNMLSRHICICMYSNTFIRQTGVFVCLWHQINIYIYHVIFHEVEHFLEGKKKKSNQLRIGARKKVPSHAYLAPWQLYLLPVFFLLSGYNRCGWAILCDRYPEFGYLCDYYFSSEADARTQRIANISKRFHAIPKIAVSIQEKY